MRDPKYKVGDVLRYSRGSTALMKVAHISVNHDNCGNHRYYGQQCMGGSVGAYESDCYPACKVDLAQWDQSGVDGWGRKQSWENYLRATGRSRNIVGIVED